MLIMLTNHADYLLVYFWNFLENMANQKPEHMNSGSVLSVNQDRRRTLSPASSPPFKSL